MAHKRAVQLQGEFFSCSICLDLLKDPVGLSCGHSYCMNCIKNHWDKEDVKMIYSCPQCRKTFSPRPDLMKNTMLAVLVEELKKTGLQTAPADLSYAGGDDVACDVCTGMKLRALKSCLVCLASYCEKHLHPHYESPPLKKHNLVDPSKNLQDNICFLHDEVMKMFCRTDQQCICYLCSVEKHKDHDTVSAVEERMRKQGEVDWSREEIQQRLQHRESDVKVLEQEVEALDRSADEAVDNSRKIFTELVCLLEKRNSDVEQQIRSQQKTEVSRVRDLQEKLQHEIIELKTKDAELKELSLTQDHNQFLLNYGSPSAISPPTHSSSLNVRPLRYFHDVTDAVSKVRHQLQDVLTETWTDISLRVTLVDVLLPQPEPKTRAEFFRYSQEIFLDPDTAHIRLLLSEKNRKVTLMEENQSYSRHPDRFTHWGQVLSRERLTGRCYWEVEWTGGGICVALTYKNIIRLGSSEECVFGFNDKSWALHCEQNSCYFRHNSLSSTVSDGVSSRVGVYLDHDEGLLSYYRVSDTMTLLHRVRTTFTQPLYAGVRFYYCSPGDTAEFCKLKC